MSEKALITYKRKRFSSKLIPTEVAKDGSDAQTEKEASSKCLHPRAEHDVEDEKMNEDIVVPEGGKEFVPNHEPSKGFPQVKGKSMDLHTNDIVEAYSTFQSLQSDIAKFETLTREESGPKLQEERTSLSEVELSAAMVSSTCLTGIKSNSQTLYYKNGNIVESKTSTQNCMLDENVEGKPKGMEWLENLDEVLQRTKEDRILSSNMEKCGTNFMVVSNRMTSSLNPDNSSVQIQLNQFSSREYINQISRAKEKLPYKNSGVSACEERQPEGASSISFVPTNVLYATGSLNFKGREVSFKDFQSRRPTPNLNFKNADYQYDMNIQHPGLSENASIPCKQASVNFPIGPETSKEKQETSLGESKSISPEWSEEELDFLWLGVRRHGHNWDAILTDSRFHFSKSKVAEDLTRQWARELKKILNVIFCEPTRLARSDISPSPFVAKHATNFQCPADTFLPTNSTLQSSRAETKRPFVDLFHQKENNFKSTLPNLSGVTIATPISVRAPSPGPFFGNTAVRSSYPVTGMRQLNNFKIHNPKYYFEPSSSCQNSVQNPNHGNQQPANSTLPHWLSEEFNRRNHKSSGSPASNSFQCMLNNKGQSSSFPNSGDPPAPSMGFHGRGVMKRKNMNSGNTGGSTKVSGDASSVDEVWLRKKLCLFPNVGLSFRRPASIDLARSSNDAIDLNIKTSGSIGTSNLIVADSGTSSEDTR